MKYNSDKSHKNTMAKNPAAMTACAAASRTYHLSISLLLEEPYKLTLFFGTEPGLVPQGAGRGPLSAKNNKERHNLCD